MIGYHRIGYILIGYWKHCQKT